MYSIRAVKWQHCMSPRNYMKNPRVMASGYAAQICVICIICFSHFQSHFRLFQDLSSVRPMHIMHCLITMITAWGGSKWTSVASKTSRLGLTSQHSQLGWCAFPEESGATRSSKKTLPKKIDYCRMPFAAMKVHYLKTLDWNNHEVACAPPFLSIFGTEMIFHVNMHAIYKYLFCIAVDGRNPPEKPASFAPVRWPTT